MGYRLIQISRTDGRHDGGIAILLSRDINLLTSTDIYYNTNYEIHYCLQQDYYHIFTNIPSNND